MNKKILFGVVTIFLLLVAGVWYGLHKTAVLTEPVEDKSVILHPVEPETPSPEPVETPVPTQEPVSTIEPVLEEAKDISSFIHVQKEKLLDEEGREFRIKGMCFGNNVWANPSKPTLTHHDESSYAELEELGFTAVRFYMNYKLFEEDDNPYVYKESGFAWLNQNIEWAREHNIRLILNMHVPQGGFISASKIHLWEDEENIKRYMALWKEIAERYADEPVILGYGLMNEPFVPQLETEEDSMNLYYGLMEALTASIREVDDRHIFFVERPYGIVDENKKVNYAWGDTGSFRLLSDDNVVYEFHFYEYTRFTSQGISWSSFERDWYYGDDRIALLVGDRQYSAICRENSTVSYDSSQGGWQYLESPVYSMADYPGNNAAYFLLYFSGLNQGATVMVDDIVVKEYDDKGEYLRNVYEYSFDSTTACSGWDLGEGTGGKCTYVDTDGHDAKGCEAITEAGGNYRLYKNAALYNNFPLDSSHRYQVCLWVKADGDLTELVVQPGLQLITAERVYALNKRFLEDKLLVYYNLGKEYQVPIYIGEFGTTSHIMGNEFHGEEWVKDVMDIFNTYHMNYSYHDYHEENYGLYTTPASKDRTAVNMTLYEVFQEKVKN